MVLARSSDGKPEQPLKPTDPSKEIDSEDEAWDGALEQSAFQQVRDAREKARIVAKLEAMNRRGPMAGPAAQPGETSSATSCTAACPEDSGGGK
mmetsp:Transcript_27002/g.71305  ORF Transcript_27002/g.71305 Transcript_27002/m.71305 type:complete len:94 (-) Transcript_27002:27-308(-)